MVNHSNIPTVQRLKFEDFARCKTWEEAFQNLIESINLFISPTFDILNGHVGYENIEAPKLYLKTITGAAPTTFTFVNPLTISPRGVVIGNVWTGIQSTHPALATSVYWHPSGNTIIIDNIVGLTVGLVYQITLVIF